MDMQADLGIFFNTDEFADTQVLRVSNSVVINAIVDVGAEYEYERGTARKIATVVFKNTELPNLQPGELLTFHGRDWGVVIVTELDRFVSRAECRTKEAFTMLG
jgi:hypothetical protein